MNDTGWYWCLDHEAVEPADASCAPDRRLGPFATEADAANRKQTYEERNETWDREDAEWEGEPPD